MKCISLSFQILAVLTSAVSSANGINVHVVTNNQFAANTIPKYADAYMSSGGTRVNIIQTTSPDDTVMRAMAAKEPIDVIILPYVTYRQYMQRGWLDELHRFLGPENAPNLAIRLRWIWGSTYGQPRCGYIPGSESIDDVRESSYACIWNHSNQKELAADFIRYLVYNVPTVDAYPIMALNFARKLYYENDYETIYDYLLHEDRKSISKADYAKQEARRYPCTVGTIAEMHWQTNWRYWNLLPVTDPLTGKRYSPMTITFHTIELTCDTGQYTFQQLLNVIIDTTKAAGIIPYESIRSWGG